MTKSLRVSLVIAICTIAIFFANNVAMQWVIRSDNYQAAYNQGRTDVVAEMQARALQAAPAVIQ